MAGTYKFMGCTIRNMGYHQPDHRVWWEAVDETGNAVAQADTLRGCEFQIFEHEITKKLSHNHAEKTADIVRKLCTWVLKASEPFDGPERCREADLDHRMGVIHEAMEKALKILEGKK